MSRTTRHFLVMAAIGVAMVAISIAGIAWYGGVPYIDGPNSGHASGPGLGRWIENHAPLIAVAGILLIIIGVTGAATNCIQQGGLRSS